MRWSPLKTMGSEMGTDAEASTRRATANDPSSKKESACRRRAEAGGGGRAKRQSTNNPRWKKHEARAVGDGDGVGRVGVGGIGGGW